MVTQTNMKFYHGVSSYFSCFIVCGKCRAAGQIGLERVDLFQNRTFVKLLNFEVVRLLMHGLWMSCGCYGQMTRDQFLYSNK